MVNIILLHEKILKNIELEEKKIDKEYSQIQFLKNGNVSISFTKKIEEFENNIKKIKKTKLFFLSKTLRIIERYEQVLKKPIVVSFTTNSDSTDVSFVDNEKNKIIEEYINIIGLYKKYHPKDINISSFTNNKSEIVDDFKCKNCDKGDIDDNVCLNCGLCIYDSDDLITSYCDSRRICVNSKNRYTNSRLIHFKECLMQYQGKENVIIPKTVYNKLIDCFKRNHLLKGDVNTPRAERFSKIIKHHIHIFLKELKYAKYYDNINLIYNKLTGKSIPNIESIEPLILNDFKMFSIIYDVKIKEMPHIDRKKNTQYILYQLLHRHKYYCDIDSFGTTKSLRRNTFNDVITHICFNELKWNIAKIK